MTDRVRVHHPVLRTIPHAAGFSVACGVIVMFVIGGVLESAPELTEGTPRAIAMIAGICAFIISLGAAIIFLLGLIPRRLLPTTTYSLVQYAIPAVGFVWSALIQSIGVALGTFCICFLSAILVALHLARRHFKELPELQAVGSALHRSLPCPPLVSHVTDVHVTKASHIGTVEGNDRDGMEALQTWLSPFASRGSRFLLVSGDLTDTGDPDEWRRVDAVFITARSDEQYLVVAPGNHDLFPYGESLQDHLRLYFEHAGKWCRSLTTCEFQPVFDLTYLANSSIEGKVEAKARELKEAYINSRPGPSNPQELAEDEDVERAWRERANTMDWFTPARDMLIRDWYRSNWRAAFPLRLDDKLSGGLVLVINSVLPTHLLGESALGELGDEQLAQVEAALKTLPDYARFVFIVTHHAPFRAPGDWRLFVPWGRGGLHSTWGRVKDFAYLGHAAHEARIFLDIVSAAADRHQNVQFVVFCGHRHQANIGRAGRVLIVEGSALAEARPSTTLIYADGPSLFVSRENILSAA